MDQLIDLLLRNPWLILLIVFGVLGNLGSSPAQKAAKKKRMEERARRHRELKERLERERSGSDPFEEPAVQEASRRVERSGDEVSRRIREILGRAQGDASSATTLAEPVRAPVVPSTVPERGGDVVGGLDVTKFDVEEMGQLDVSDFEGFADALTEMDDGASRQQLPRDLSPPRRPNLPRGLRPNQLILAQLLMGPPRAFTEYDSEGSALLR